MTQKEILDELKALIVERLKFDPRRAAEMTAETTLPKGVEGSLGLDDAEGPDRALAGRQAGPEALRPHAVGADHAQPAHDDAGHFTLEST